jgi:hypothetical protein
MSKHTPGPWSPAYIYGAMRHIERNVDRDAFLAEEDQKAINDGVLTVPNCRYNPADVAAMVAAPDMLEALEAVEAWWNAHGIEGDHRTDAFCTLARNAIKKARGQT